MIIFIPIEVSLREKIPKIFLAYQILKYTNFKVIIGGQRYLNQKIKDFKYCIWLDKHTFHERLKKRNIDKSNHVIVIDEEGPVSFADDFGTKVLYSKFFFNLINSLILWGKKDFEKIPKLKDKHVNIETLGHPKFDLLKNKYVKIFNKEVGIIKKKYKNFVLIPGSYSQANSVELELSLTRAWAKKNNISKKITNNWLRYNALERENYLNFLKIVKKIAIENPNINFIFRKHPTEDQEKLIKFFGQIPKNLKLVNKFSVTPWIIASNYYLHSGCTTSIEASILKKKIIFYSTKSLSKHSRYKNFKLSNLNFTDDNKCLSFFKNINKKKTKYKAKDIGNFIYNNNEKNFFYKDFIKLIKKINLKKDSLIEFRKENHNWLIKMYLIIRNIILKILSIIKNKIFLESFLLKYLPEKHIFGKKLALRKFINLKKSEIDDMILRLNNLDKSKIRVKTIKISNSVYKLERI